MRARIRDGAGADEGRVAKARRVWDAYAPRYDRAMRPAERWWFTGGRPWVASRAEGEVLEVAIGTGLNLPHYPSGVRVTGIDISPQMLTVARERAAALGRAVRLQVGDAQALPFADAAFDTVVCTLGLCGIPDDRAAIAEMKRVLRPGGRLLLLDHVGSTWWPLWAGQRLVEVVSVRVADEHLTRRSLPLLVEAGFAIVQSRRRRAGTVELVFARRV
jgi:ubiquinone/menaquinone biosynthesis C-methylase UbiE